MVISYGDSLYNGAAPVSHVDDDVEHTHITVCSQLENEVQGRRDLLTDYFASQSGEQTVPGSPADVQEAIMAPIEHLYVSNCAHVDKPYRPVEEGSASGSGDIGDSKRALLEFMIAATPNDQVLHAINACEMVRNVRDMTTPGRKGILVGWCNLLVMSRVLRTLDLETYEGS